MTATIQAYGAIVTPFTIQKAVALSGLEFHIPLAQLLSLEAVALMTFTVKEVLVDIPKKNFEPFQTKHTLYGIPIVLDKTVSDGVIELRLGDQVLSRIENLAVPCGMETQQ